MTQTEALIHLLAECAHRLSMGDHSYIVGGAPRDYHLGHDVKDLDVVVETRDGKNAATLAQAVAKVMGVECHPDHYGVVHLGPVFRNIEYRGVDLHGAKVEIVTARKEKYNRLRERDSHKPAEVSPGSIIDDLLRRDFTINTLMWRLKDLLEGPSKAPILDFLGKGLQDLADKTLRTPLDPVDTFDDDPSRMLRAIRFAVKYSMVIERETYEAIQSRAAEITRLPSEVVADVFIGKILALPKEQIHMALHVLSFTGLTAHVIRAVPTSRMRRGISGRITDPATILALARFGFDTGIRFSEHHVDRLWELYQESEGSFNELFARYRRPLETEALIAATNITGPTVNEALNYAKELVLQGLSTEEVYTNTLERYKVMSNQETRKDQIAQLKKTLPEVIETARRLQRDAENIALRTCAAFTRLINVDEAELIDNKAKKSLSDEELYAFTLAAQEVLNNLNAHVDSLSQVADAAREIELGASTHL